MRSRTASTACRARLSASGDRTGAPVGLLRDRRGQATVEIALLVVAFLAIAIGLGAIWHLLDAGAFVQHAVASASHCVGASIGAWADVLAY